MAAAPHAAPTRHFRRPLAASPPPPPPPPPPPIPHARPQTPVRVEIRAIEKFPVCAYPRSSHGNAVIRVRASSTATQRNGAATSARLIEGPDAAVFAPAVFVPSGFDPATTASSSPNIP